MSVIDLASSPLPLPPQVDVIAALYFEAETAVDDHDLVLYGKQHPSPYPLPQGEGGEESSIRHCFLSPPPLRGRVRVGGSCLSVDGIRCKEKNHPLPLREGVGGGVRILRAANGVSS